MLKKRQNRSFRPGFYPKLLQIRRLIRGFISCFRPRFKILAYHSLNHVSRDPYEVKAEVFEEQIGFLAEERYKVVGLEEAVRIMAKGIIRDKTVVITFDDGFASLSDFAFPVLKNFDFPATVFLPFNYIGGIDAFSYDKPRPDMPVLGWADIEDSTKYGIVYGSHTMSHRNLAELDDTELSFELSESKNILKRRLGLDFYALAYPFGMFDERVKQVVRDAGYDCALCFGNILSNTKSTDVFEMKREKILNSTSLDDFADLIDVRKDSIRKIRDIIRRALIINA